MSSAANVIGWYVYGLCLLEDDVKKGDKQCLLTREELDLHRFQAVCNKLYVLLREYVNTFL